MEVGTSVAPLGLGGGRGLGRGTSGNPAPGRVHRPHAEQTGTTVADPTPGTEPTQDEPTQDAPEPSHEHGHDSPDHYPTEDDPA